jgi:UDP-2,3-diacylglucosamine pyrophosphatase LpxH
VQLLLDFLRQTRCDTLYLVGDIIDLESLRNSFFWPTSHTEVLRALLKKSQEGTRVVYIPGNHDDDMRVLIGTRIGHVEVLGRCVHTTAAGRRLLVLHGDEFDAMIKHGFLAALVGAVAYRSLLSLNRFVHWLHEISARPYWSLAQHVKTKIGGAQRYIAAFRNASLRAAEAAGVDGIVCGHIHKAELVERDGLVYCNDGDWVESCTALVERPDGALELLTWRTQAAVAAVGQPLRDAA